MLQRLLQPLPLLAVLIFGISAPLHAQDQQYTIAGVMEMKTGEAIPYKVVFTEQEGSISGYSYTFTPPRETKAVITGSVDRFEHKLLFRETEIVSSHNVPTKAFLCLVNASLVYEKSYKGATLSGSISNRQTDRTSCTPGKLIFNGTDDLAPLFDARASTDTVITMHKRTPKPAGIKVAVTEEAPRPEETERVTAGTAKSYNWRSDTIVVDIWDGGDIDGDRVSIIFDNEALLEKYPLGRQRKRLKIPLPAIGTHTLAIRADNEGSDPPNTATLLLTDGDRKYKVVAYNPMGQQAIISFRRAQ